MEEGYHARRIGLLEIYYESLGVIKFDVRNLHPFSCDMALAVNDPTEGGLRRRHIDDFVLHKVRDRLGYDFDSWLKQPGWKIRNHLARLRLLSKPKDGDNKEPPKT